MCLRGLQCPFHSIWYLWFVLFIIYYFPIALLENLMRNMILLDEQTNKRRTVKYTLYCHSGKRKYSKTYQKKTYFFKQLIITKY